MNGKHSFDVVIIGGSYAGLAAAMSLGRSGREVLIIDAGNPCNAAAPQAHNLITHDGSSPAAIRLAAKEQVLQYKTIQFLNGTVLDAKREGAIFELKTDGGDVFTAKKLFFASGLKDIMPDIKGFSACWGKTILHCPYCHGYEFSNQKTAVLCNDSVGFEFAKVISNWTKDLKIFSNGKANFDTEQRVLLAKHNIDIIETEIRSIEHHDGVISAVITRGEQRYELNALYAHVHFKQQTDLPRKLGCNHTEHDLIEVDAFQHTNEYGIYAAGDNSSWGRSLSVAIAAGTIGGVMVNKELIEESFL